MAGRMIEYAANGGKASGYLAQPDGQGNGKGLVVIQEYWGLVPHIKDVTDRFARLGYTALAPDLWNGAMTTDPGEAMRMLMALNIDDAAQKLRGAIAALHAHGASGKVGAIGYCMGGILALYAGCASPDEVGAVAAYYAIHPHVHPDFARLRAPVLAVYAKQDEYLPPTTGPELAEKIRAAGGRCELHLYEHAGHAFFNDSRPQAYHKESAEDAWEKTKAFFAQNL